MWHFGSKYWRIRALVKANHKRLKADLASGFRKLSPLSLASKLDEFSLFDSFFDFLSLNFPDLDNFRDLDIFWPFNFPDFLAIFTLPTPSTPSLLSQSPTSSLSEVHLSGGAVVFSIEVSETAILLKPWMNCR